MKYLSVPRVSRRQQQHVEVLGETALNITGIKTLAIVDVNRFSGSINVSNYDTEPKWFSVEIPGPFQFLRKPEIARLPATFDCGTNPAFPRRPPVR